MLKTDPPFNTNTNPRVSSLALAALGIVYGDIGTSPLYALRECFNPDRGVPVNDGNVLGPLAHCMGIIPCRHGEIHRLCLARRQ
jgi:K+ transporter